MPDFLTHWQISHSRSRAQACTQVHNLLISEYTGTFSALSHGRPLTWTAYFALDARYYLSILTSPRSEHGSAITPGSPISMCVYRRPTVWGEPIYGLQAFGVIETIGDIAAESAYCERFPQYAEWRAAGGVTESLFYSIRMTSIKLIDEEHFGEETYVVLRDQ